ncbi:MAG: methyltransferase [Planctomycetes bacterium]|nr:methyltransferase [Planctomycetota bacterium]MBI3847031.1 methyltransferase [Planctomycetota bacterium]
MATAPSSDSNPVPLHSQVIQLATSYWISRALYVCAKFGIADLLSNGARSADDLARTCGTDRDATYRLLRALAMVGLFTETDPRRFALTSMGRTLRTGEPGAARSTVLALAGQWMWAGWGEFEHAMKTGKPGTEKALGMPVFDYFAKHPEEAGWFNDAMIGFHGPETIGVAKSYDFSAFSTVVDVGGGTGNLLSAILRSAPRLAGILYDLPHVAEAARAKFAERELSDRLRIIAGSFMESVPAGDAYVLSHVIHDWDEPTCLKILGNCRRANPKATVLLVEMVIPPGDEPHPGKILDLVMLNCPGGRERTADEYRELLDGAGYRMTRVLPTGTVASVIEGVPK